MKGRALRRAAPPVSREASKQQTREALVTAALELFAEDGLDAPSLDAICDRAGYTRGAFYVHFPDRDALLVAVMEKVGEGFLASMFEQVTAPEDEPKRSAPAHVSVLAIAARRFVAAIHAGTYPLLPPPGGPPSARSAARSPQIKPHQLLEACARSPIVRERYRALVEASIEHVAHLARADQAAGRMKAELDPTQVGTLLLATIVGAQTLAELGVTIDIAALTEAALASVNPGSSAT